MDSFVATSGTLMMSMSLLWLARRYAQDTDRGGGSESEMDEDTPTNMNLDMVVSAPVEPAFNGGLSTRSVRITRIQLDPPIFGRFCVVRFSHDTWHTTPSDTPARVAHDGEWRLHFLSELRTATGLDLVSHPEISFSWGDSVHGSFAFVANVDLLASNLWTSASRRREELENVEQMFARM